MSMESTRLKNKILKISQTMNHEIHIQDRKCRESMKLLKFFIAYIEAHTREFKELSDQLINILVATI